ncbi:MAG: nucleotide sugar dehydrogenase [Verrucomicrobiaceae bacterium]|nr:nucleotide sugar dehydrogenase [Verrucomicrobiaceae bacterium]
MDVSIFGLGYVGAVTAGCLTEGGHRVVGVDVQMVKVEAFNAGKSPIIEPELDEMLSHARRVGLLKATVDVREAITETQLSIVCVGTPSLASGRLNLDYVRKVTQQIREALVLLGKSHTLVFRSTMLPGSTRQMVSEFLADLIEGGRLKVFYCPEFLREGTAVSDFREPSLSVLGTHDGLAPADVEIAKLLGGDPEFLSWDGAEMIKYACNYFHAIKVGFANEIGRLSKCLGVDGARVMNVVCQDAKLNISRYYMRPGNPFGGSCLPKDVSALSSLARMEGVSMPLLDSTLSSNQSHLDALIKQITQHETRRVGLLGLSFKEDTDDLRGSPMVAVAETLLGRGYQLQIYDPQLNLTRLVGANEAEIQRRMPHLASLLRNSAVDVVAASDLIIVSQACADPNELLPHIRPDQRIIDVNGWASLRDLPCHYEGLCW